MRVALLTITFNEHIFFPKWIEHYRGQGFSDADTYVLDHMSNDGHLDPYRAQLHIQRVSKCGGEARTDEEYDHGWLLATVHDKVEELLKDYNYVVFSETDELLVMDPLQGRTLMEVIESNQDIRMFRAQCWEPIELVGEQPVDWSRPVLGQRTKWFRQNGYDKTLIVSRYPNWNKGFHESHSTDIHAKMVFMGLYMIHLQHICKKAKADRYTHRPIPNSGYRVDCIGDGVVHMDSPEEARWVYDIPDEWKASCV